MLPEARVAAFIGRAKRQVAAIESARAIAFICGAGAVWLLVRSRAGATATELFATAAFFLLIAAVVAAVRVARSVPAAIVESRTHAFRNALLTSAQLIDGGLQAKPGIRELVLTDTAARAEHVNLGAVLPARLPLSAAGLALIAFAAALAFGVTRPAAAERARALSGSTAAGAGHGRVAVVVTPPSYTGLRPARLDNPERIEAIEGARVALLVDDRVAVEAVASNQTYLQSGGILIPMTVTPDRAPDVRVTEPARDLFLPNAAREIPVRVTARDDFGATSLTLAYTKVSGSGETFEFVEGTLPISVSRTSARDITGAGVIRLEALGLAAGDMIVYRAIARDAHPSRGPAESDAFVIEILPASEAIAEGFSIDDQRDKYALSQQMVILKTERLAAARRSMTSQAVVEEAARIAAEQRQVRAEFVFMMGGEIEDEEVEAEQSHEITEGREQNEGRRDLLAAIRNMSDAAALLLRPEIDQALAVEKRALAALQRALTRSRYILRVLGTRERIDDSRRLSGDRTGAAGWRRDRPAGDGSPDTELLRQALHDVALLARKTSYSDTDRETMTAIAKRLLTLGRGAELGEAVDPLTTASRTRDARAVAQLIDRAALAIDTALEQRSPALSASSPAVSDRVRSALAARLRANRTPGGPR